MARPAGIPDHENVRQFHRGSPTGAVDHHRPDRKVARAFDLTLEIEPIYRLNVSISYRLVGKN
jgi:hypothetical protein